MPYKPLGILLSSNLPEEKVEPYKKHPKCLGYKDAWGEFEGGNTYTCESEFRLSEIINHDIKHRLKYFKHEAKFQIDREAERLGLKLRGEVL